MSPALAINLDAIRQVLLNNPGITTKAAAATLTRDLGHRVTETLIWGAVHKNPEYFEDVQRAPAGRPSALDYEALLGFGPIDPRHKRTKTWYHLTAILRLDAGLTTTEKASVADAVNWLCDLMEDGLVIDYAPADGFDFFPAMPWECGGFLRRAAPREDQ